MTRGFPQPATPAAIVAAFVAGAVFAVGLVLAGMTQPAKVIAFLDVGGAWDPTLAFVMVGAIASHVAGLWLTSRRTVPLFASDFSAPTRKDISAPLVLGAAVFGIGWGLVGYCPGPALASLGSGADTALVFVGAATAGMLLQHAAKRTAVSP
ncbi:MAG TPA: DUF6691 family protein [Kofleriaceae bacterium]|nr:DUF6691 family protein [Kofleriaceae bacterium]